MQRLEGKYPYIKGNGIVQTVVYIGRLKYGESHGIIDNQSSDEEDL